MKKTAIYRGQKLVLKENLLLCKPTFSCSGGEWRERSQHTYINIYIHIYISCFPRKLNIPCLSPWGNLKLYYFLY
jgi:hypothetical protein